MAKAHITGVAMDSDLPQTKYAHSLPAFDGEIPSYVAKIDALAREAGLTVRHGRDTYFEQASLVAIYSGDRDQIRHCKLIEHSDSLRWPGTSLRPTHPRLTRSLVLCHLPEAFRCC